MNMTETQTTYEIRFAGNQHTNSSSRNGHIPTMIVDHISAGSWSSLLSWFTSPNNKVSSSNYGVSKKGDIVCFVPIDRMAWANGIGAAEIASSNTPIIRDHLDTNPNLYSVSIEHEGTDGDLTEEQYQATLWLHKHIRDEVKRIWGYEMGLTPYDVIGHNFISKAKPLCPGEFFPWERLYQDLSGVKKEMRTLSLSKDYMNGMLVNALHQLYVKSTNGELEHPLLTNYNWVQDAYEGKLSADDLSWLAVVLLAKDKGIAL